ncbi:hypothetical protein H6G89_23280 [Oscillatoria sp. FACHB-1407]|uniref:hypothetical protein n=1 Tax=Oscillatoria sp. FACHB-1407 TaxID=2692847 RepID=UPI0016838A9F|nr:hypothetical protein [Oscillatoria sp. FACHB-1407]MBD2463929.1 hypothetical protein [Oscillatoria sp. FACHB-1407]
MADTSDLKIMIDISQVDPDLEPEELESLTDSLKNEISELVEDAELVRESEIPEGGKPALAGFVLGILKTEVSVKNIQALMGVLQDRFGSKPIELTGEKNGNKFSIKVGKPEDLDQAVAAFQKLAEAVE